MLWLSLYFPHLALDVLMRGNSTEAGPLAIYGTQNKRQRIYARNRAAAKLGIEPGMSMSAALSLSAQLQTYRRDEAAECAALEGIAIWAEQFTPTISLDPPQGVLLEIAGSLTLFGGVETLRRRILQGLNEMGYHPRTAVAPTPLGARLLSLAGDAQAIIEKALLQSRLHKLPITVLEIPENALQALRNMGLRTLGDCLQLPRGGLSRRLGTSLIQSLDRALGKLPDPRPSFIPPPHFSSSLNFSFAVHNSEALLFAAHRLLLELTGFLLARGSGVQEIQLELHHAKKPASHLRLALATPSRDAEHLRNLLREQLERYRLQAPIEAIRISAEQLLPLEHHNRDLFIDTTAQQAWPQLLERLQARLGKEAVRSLCVTDDHRPERAWRYCTPGAAQAVDHCSQRPLWLLETPSRLEIREGHPWLHSKLELLQGPERIESGWWDGNDVCRDYFVAENARYERLWIFRQRHDAEAWYLHGIFA